MVTVHGDWIGHYGPRRNFFAYRMMNQWISPPQVKSLNIFKEELGMKGESRDFMLNWDDQVKLGEAQLTYFSSQFLRFCGSPQPHINNTNNAQPDLAEYHYKEL